MFTQAKEYDEMLQRGIKFSGENKEFFISGRLRDLLNQLPQDFSPRFILDFGCGIGDTTYLFSQVFPNAYLVGVDINDKAILYATESHGSNRLVFHHLTDLDGEAVFDLCYANGVFHHIIPSERLNIIHKIRNFLTDEGYFAFFENNPWNLGTRLVMKQIPFDRDASLISPPASIRLLRKAGFQIRNPVRFLFFFPRFLRFLRGIEAYLARVPLGAQYYILAKKSFKV